MYLCGGRQWDPAATRHRCIDPYCVSVYPVYNDTDAFHCLKQDAGTDVVRVSGVRKLHGSEYPIIPDQIEAGTFMFAAAKFFHAFYDRCISFNLDI
mgnify:CR=1 FL=1